MADEPAAQPELSESNPDEINPSGTEDMDLESASNQEAGANGDANGKRSREEEGDDGVPKKQKVGDEGAEDAERSVEEERLDKVKEGGENGSDRVKVGPKEFGSSVEMFDYFYKLLHFWPPSLNVNKVGTTFFNFTPYFHFVFVLSGVFDCIEINWKKNEKLDQSNAKEPEQSEVLILIKLMCKSKLKRKKDEILIKDEILMS